MRQQMWNNNKRKSMMISNSRQSREMGLFFYPPKQTEKSFKFFLPEEREREILSTTSKRGRIGHLCGFTSLKGRQT